MNSINRIDYLKDLKKGIHDGIPIALGYISVSFTFGIMGAAVHGPDHDYWNSWVYVVCECGNYYCSGSNYTRVFTDRKSVV